MPGGPPRRQRTSRTAGGAGDSNRLTSSLVPITGPAYPAPAASDWLRTGDKLRFSVDNPAYGGAVPAPACGQTWAARLPPSVRPVSALYPLWQSADRHGQQRHQLIAQGQGAVQPYQGRFMRLRLSCHDRARTGRRGDHVADPGQELAVNVAVTGIA